MSVYKLKMVMIGDAGAGKSCIIHRFIFNMYNEFGNATIGAQFLTKEINNCKLDIWDTAGQERFRSLIPMYLRHASLICLVVSLDNPPEDIENQKTMWLDFMDHHNTMMANHKKIVVYNKFDLRPDFKMEPDERFDCSMVISCKTNYGMNDFSKALDDLVIHIENASINSFLKPIVQSAPQPSSTNDTSSSRLNFYDYLPRKEYLSSMKCNLL